MNPSQIMLLEFIPIGWGLAMTLWMAGRGIWALFRAFELVGDA